ncbi:MAG: deoxyribodipyrimidine photolyase [Planctomycetia bacterium]|nr:deoxyribodipyrimidine photolyase [Planctomycetia bacterium]
MAVPALRVRAANDRPLAADGRYVLLWMIGARRTRWSHALDRAAELAREAGKPLLVFEALRCGHRWASARFHAFVLQGMADNAEACARAGLAYLPYVEPEPGAGRGLLAALAAHAVAVVTDDVPGFFQPRMVAAAARRLRVRLEAVDGHGVLPLAATPKPFPTAYAFRRFLQRELPAHLAAPPRAEPLARAADLAGAAVPREVLDRWPRAGRALLEARPEALAALPVDATVGPVATRGGAVAAAAALEAFLAARLGRYGERNEPDADAASGLSPWLHFGHVSSHEVVAAVLARERVKVADLVAGGDGSREGWWRASPAAEGFLDQIVTWRELGAVTCHHRPDDFDRWEALPAWARATLLEHARDPRPVTYDLDTLEAARTHDDVWNAAQRELVRTGRMHNYLRMLWGKKVLEWSPTPQAALETLIHLNNKWALDGRDPNSYAGILWTFGLHDRPWAPERPIFGTIRYMSSANTKKKLALKAYLARFGDAPVQGGLGFT